MNKRFVSLVYIKNVFNYSRKCYLKGITSNNALIFVYLPFNGMWFFPELFVLSNATFDGTFLLFLKLSNNYSGL
jgi:hypothetical protein